MSMLTGKRTVVTGGGSGIGLGVARLFLQEGGRGWPLSAAPKLGFAAP